MWGQLSLGFCQLHVTEWGMKQEAGHLKKNSFAVSTLKFQEITRGEGGFCYFILSFFKAKQEMFT